MYVQTGKTFIATLIAVVLSLGGLAWLSSDGRKSEPTTLAQASQIAQTTPQSSPAYDASTSTATTTGQTTYEEGYRAGYRDGHQDCATTQASQTRSSVSRTYYTPRRSRVASARYETRRRGHSTRNMILTIAGPAAVGAGIGGIVRGGKGAGVGALLGGGGGALYYLLKNRNR